MNGNKINQNMNSNNNNMDNNNMTQQLDYTYEELKGKTVMISLLEDDDDEGYDESIEYIPIETMEDYNTLEQIIADYEVMGILDEYWIAE